MGSLSLAALVGCGDADEATPPPSVKPREAISYLYTGPKGVLHDQRELDRELARLNRTRPTTPDRPWRLVCGASGSSDRATCAWKR